MEKYNLKEYAIELFKGVYGIFSTNYRMARFEEMKKSGELDEMCSSEVHKKFLIWGEK